MTDRSRLRMFGGSTALVRQKPSRPYTYWKANGLLQGQVLDFGAGDERHKFAKYDIVTSPDPAPLLRQWDTVMCNYVLNVQPSDHLVTQILVLLAHLVGTDGRVLIGVLTGAEAGKFSVGGRMPKTVSQWEAHISTIFDIEKVSAPFAGYVCRNKTWREKSAE